MGTFAQHNGSLPTARQLAKILAEKIDFPDGTCMLDVGGGSGAFSIVFAEQHQTLTSTVLEFPEVFMTGRNILATAKDDVQSRVKFEFRRDLCHPSHCPLGDGT